MRPVSWREAAVTAAMFFLITIAGCGAAFSVWLNDLSAPQIAVLGCGNRLCLLVVDGSARLLIASGDEPIEFENAMSQVRPIFARRVDVLLVAGGEAALLVPLAAYEDRHVRRTFSLAPLPESPESEAFRAIPAHTGPSHITLGPSLRVTIETRYPFGADPATDFPAWRAIVERNETRVLVLSDGEAGNLFSPVDAVSVLVVSGDDPIAGWHHSPAPTLVANAAAIEGPDLRSAFPGDARPPEWGFLVFSGEALRMRFVDGGIEIPSESAHDLR